MQQSGIFKHSEGPLVGIGHKGNTTVVQNAVQAVAGLSLPAECTDERTLAGMAAPPDADLRPKIETARQHLSTAGALMSAGRYQTGLTTARELREEAEALGWAPLTAFQSDNWKWIDAPTAELYELSRDPGERQNLVGSEPEDEERMRGRLDRFRQRVGEPSSGPGKMNAEVEERLRSLGYLGD